MEKHWFSIFKSILVSKGKNIVFMIFKGFWVPKGKGIVSKGKGVFGGVIIGFHRSNCGFILIHCFCCINMWQNAWKLWQNIGKFKGISSKVMYNAKLLLIIMSNISYLYQSTKIIMTYWYTYLGHLKTQV